MHKVVLRLPDSWSNWNLEVLVFEERENRSTQRKTSHSKGENQHRVVKSSQLPAKIATYLISIGQLLLNKTSLDWPLTWTTQSSTSKLLDNPATTNSTHIWRRHWDLNPGHICGRQVLLPHYTILAPHKAVVTAIFKICFQKNEAGFQSVSFIYVYVYWSSLTSG